MRDSVELYIGGKKFEHFTRYSIDADLYQAADSFSIELSRPEERIAAGSPCQLYINGERELTGIVDRVRRGYDKRGTTVTLEGRDLMGLLVDHYCEQFTTVQGKTVKELANMLLKTVPFINRRQVYYQEEVVGKLKGKKQTVSTPLAGFLDTPQKQSQIEPGMTVFEVLSIYAGSRGLLFYGLPDGSFVFGRPNSSGPASYRLGSRLDGRGNNVKSGAETVDLSRRWSKIKVISQHQGHDADGLDATRVNAVERLLDDSFPYYKPFVTRLNNDSQTPKLHARLLQEKQRFEGYQLEYTAAGHSQAGRNWRINELCNIEDESLPVRGDFLVFGRTFQMDKRSGSTTSLRLGLPGLVVLP